MLLYSLLLSASVAAGVAIHGPPKRDAVAELNVLALRKLGELEAQRSWGHPKKVEKCTQKNAAVRKDWAVLSTKEKKEYINAVLCIQSKSAITPASVAPGAKSRYDDFVATHINQTMTIHGTGNFFAWHRYLVWAYEKALRDECGYKGYQPYWNWGAFADDQTKSPVFDGSDTSMSGDGEFVQHNGSLSGANNIFIPSGKGGGCVTSGPFKNMTVHLGPVFPGMAGIVPAAGNGLQDNPRCLRRDISNYVSQNWMRTEDIAKIISQSPDIRTFDSNIEGRFDEGYLGPHASGHFLMGGDATDLFGSIVDPAFYLHHAMLDRAWFTWQSLNAPASWTAIYGTRTILNTPPSPNATVDDLQDLGFNAGPVKLGDLLNTMGGPFCYIYV